MLQVIKFYRLTDGSPQKGRQIGHLAVCVPVYSSSRIHTNTQVRSLLYNRLQASACIHTHIIILKQCMHHWNCLINAYPLLIPHVQCSICKSFKEGWYLAQATLLRHCRIKTSMQHALRCNS